MADSLEEKAVLGTLTTVAAAAAVIVPWGTVASVVIMAGIAIFKGVEAAKEAELKAQEQLQSAIAQDDYLKVLKTTIDKANKRPRIPLDLYSGPPMYWIVPSKTATVTDTQYYQLPNDGKVWWPCGNLGGRSPIKGTNGANDYDSAYMADDIYGPFPPTVNNNPTICIFFWAVPIFFARLQQLLGEGIYGGGPDGYDPAQIDKVNGKTQGENLANKIKAILAEGYLDGAGNWFGKIGTVVPPIAANDEDFAARYYGRSAWVHNLAMQNIKYADGTRIVSTGIKYNNNPALFVSESAKTAIAASSVAAIANPRFIAVNGNPYYLTSILAGTNLIRGTTPVPNSGWVLDIQTLAERYNKYDGSTSDVRSGLLSGATSDNKLYYVVNIPQFKTYKSSIPENYKHSMVLKDAGPTINEFTTADFYSAAIRFAGGFFMRGLSYSIYQQLDPVVPNNSEFIYSRIHGAFTLAPYRLYIESQVQSYPDHSACRPRIGPGFSDTIHTSYAFMDFDPENAGLPGLAETSESEPAFTWIKNLALMPCFKADDKSSPDELKWEAIESSGIYNSWSWIGSSGFNVDKANDAWNNETMVYRTFKTISATSGWNEIIKLRPPLAGEPTVRLTKEFWGEGAGWASKLNKSEVDFAINPASTIYVFEFAREQMSGIETNEAPLTRAYYRTNLEENKPIVELQGRANPSPFYCGRRADPRTQFAWKSIRAAEVKSTSSDTTITGWENCAEWSWPYPTGTLHEISKVSSKLYAKHKEGIGRAGLSISMIATGPTIWGDASLLVSRWTSISAVSSDVTSASGFARLKTKSMWTAIMEMQSGANARYSMMKDNLNSSFAQSMQDGFARYGNSKTAEKSYLKDAQDALDAGNPPKIMVNGKYMNLKPEEAAKYCMSIVDNWYNRVIPRPTNQFQAKFNKANWDANVLEIVADAHIRLKNWAIDLGRPANQKQNVPFPSDVYGIDFFGINSASKIAIESLNSIENKDAIVTNPFQYGVNEVLNSKRDTTTVLSENRKKPTPELLKPPVLIAAAATLTTVAIIAKLKAK